MDGAPGKGWGVEKQIHRRQWQREKQRQKRRWLLWFPTLAAALVARMRNPHLRAKLLFDSINPPLLCLAVLFVIPSRDGSLSPAQAVLGFCAVSQKVLQTG